MKRTTHPPAADGSYLGDLRDSRGHPVARRLASGLALACAAWLSTAPQARAQQGQVRDVIDQAPLGAVYAGLLNLGASPDLSAASYHVTGQEVDTDIDLLRVPLESPLAALPGGVLKWKAAGSYLRSSDVFPMDVPPFAPGAIDSTWTTFGLTGGLFGEFPLGGGFTIAPGIDLNVARLESDADYSGGAKLLKPYVDGPLFNWHTESFLAAPNLRLTWSREEAGHRIGVDGHASWSRITSFRESDSMLDFTETMGTYSLRADYAAPAGMTLLARPVDWVVLAGYSGFWGTNRNALGFETVAEVGAGIEVPVSKTPEKQTRARLTCSSLFGEDIRGWSAGFGLRF